MIGCYCDYDPPEFLSVKIRKSRRTYKCKECCGEIRPGDRYEYVFGKWAGAVDAFCVCEHCHDLRQWVKNNVPCFCWSYGNMEEDAKEAVYEAFNGAPRETAGLRFGFLRRLIKRRRFYDARRAERAAE